jgi:hypothetical protein
MIRRWRIHPLWLLNWPLPGRIQGDDDLAREPNFFNQRRLHLAMDSSWIGDVCASEIAEFFPPRLAKPFRMAISSRSTWARFVMATAPILFALILSARQASATTKSGSV